MKILIRDNSQLASEGRWDLDYHLPPELVKAYPKERLVPVSKLAKLSKRKVDPTSKPDDLFSYVDISCVDVVTGAVVNPQELTGAEAPSRARMLIEAFDLVVSTCRPTRGAIAVIPTNLHGQVCSTGFAVLRCKTGVNPYYLHFVLRLASTMEQFRKLSTGSSYPAILDDDVLRVQVPIATPAEQDAIAQRVVAGLKRRNELVEQANQNLAASMKVCETSLCASKATDELLKNLPTGSEGVQTSAVEEAKKGLPVIPTGEEKTENEGELFAEAGVEATEDGK